MYRSARTLPVLLLAVVLALLAGGTVSADAAPNPSGFVRVGHLAPEVGPVTVTLTPAGAEPEELATAADYGTVSDYRTVTPGEYTLAMRTAGAPASDPPLLAAQVTVEPGQAYTVLATGTPDDLVTRVIDDMLTQPPAEQASVRLIQGSPGAENLTVATVDGPVLARDVAYGSATGYGDVPAGRWSLTATTRDGGTVTVDDPVVDLPGGRVVSLIVTDGPDGGYTVTTVMDAQGVDRSLVPVGAVQAGGGGTSGFGVPWMWMSLAAWVLVVGVAAARSRPAAVRA